MGRTSKIMAPTSCFTGQVHRLADVPKAHGAIVTRPKVAPAKSRSADLRHVLSRITGPRSPLTLRKAMS